MRGSVIVVLHSRSLAALAVPLALLGCSTDPGAPRDGGRRVDSSFDAARPSMDAGDAGCVPVFVVEPTLLPECPFCMGGRCVPGDSLPMESRARLADCSPTHECLPDEFLLTSGNFTPPTCRSNFGVEGRCLSTCLPSVMAIADTVPQDSCEATHRCVPCYDPRTGADTSACSQGCDRGPVEPPRVIAPCCDGLGYCVPPELVPESSRDVFAECAEGGELCVPIVLATMPEWTPPACSSATYGAGACLHRCFAAVEPYRAFLMRETCDDEFLCVPCTDPTSGMPTGACAPMSADGGVRDAAASDAAASDAAASDAGAAP